MALSFVITTVVYPHILSFARKHNIVDNPNARKLQRAPVPVMGGATVFIGLTVSVLVGYALIGEVRMVKVLALLLVMFLLGAWDDIKEVAPALRFVVECIVVWLIIFLLDVKIDHLHGLWGQTLITDVVSVPLSIVAGVGIMNAVNLIDGVDGYCSSFGIMACLVYAVVFFISGELAMFTLALIAAGALVPFFFHNVFGKSSKMFLGDGGSLMLGTLLVIFTFFTLSAYSPCRSIDDSGLSLVALTLATMAVPVFDTLKVMTTRVLKGGSPFHPDKTHLHHLFIEMNFTHLFTSGIIVGVNFLMVLLLLASWSLGASVDLQLYIVVALALLFTWGFYFFMEGEHRKNEGEGSEYFRKWSMHGKIADFTSSRTWQFIRRVVDSHFLGGSIPEDSTQEEGTSHSRPDPRV